MFTVRANRKGYSVYNAACAFDIETSSFVDNGNKTAIMYAWALDLDGEIRVGRTWDEFLSLYHSLIDKYNISLSQRLIIYVHNLEFEFQFMRKLFEWKDIFSLEERKPIYALTVDGIEFRCSYKLTNMSLQQVGDNLRKPLPKLVGDLDYSLIRHSETELSKEEWQYLRRDVEIVVAKIREEIDRCGNITAIPLTATGYVRRIVKANCISQNPNRAQYTKLMRTLTLTEEQFSLCRAAYAGGFAHANPAHVGKTIKNVSSFDITSSYPTVMVAEKFPMSAPQETIIKDISDLDFIIENYCCLIDITYVGLVPRVWFDSYISENKCSELYNPTYNNGRITSADMCRLVVTELDYKIIRYMYEYDEILINKAYIMEKRYLPTEVVESVLSIYAQKTKLKGIKDKKAEYNFLKQLLNSIYGMCVTNICRDNFWYKYGLWGADKANVAEALARENKSFSRFLYYPWGVWVSAYARRNLFEAICTIADDYVAADTDSVKIINLDRHKEFFTEYNEGIQEKLLTAIRFHKLEESLIRPKNAEGKEKPLGVWDYEGTAAMFKTLGAKRYIQSDGTNLKITIAGLTKDKGRDYMLRQGKSMTAVFDFFNDNMIIPAEDSGKLCHTYIDENRQGIITDYTGISCPYSEDSAVHLQPTPFSMRLADNFKEYLKSFDIGCMVMGNHAGNYTTTASVKQCLR